MWFRYGLKAQKLLAQGNTLGISAISLAPCKGKSFKKYKDIKTLLSRLEIIGLKKARIP